MGRSLLVAGGFGTFSGFTAFCLSENSGRWTGTVFVHVLKKNSLAMGKKRGRFEVFGLVSLWIGFFAMASWVW